MPKKKQTPAARCKGKKAEDEAAKLAEIWSREMALEGLKKIFEASIEGARVEVLDECGEVVSVKFSPQAANVARAALDAANKMLGYTTPAEDDADDEGDGVLRVELGEAEEFAD